MDIKYQQKTPGIVKEVKVGAAQAPPAVLAPLLLQCRSLCAAPVHIPLLLSRGGIRRRCEAVHMRGTPVLHTACRLSRLLRLPPHPCSRSPGL